MQESKYYKIVQKDGDVLMIVYETEYDADCRCRVLGDNWGCKAIEITKSEFVDMSSSFRKANREFGVANGLVK